MELGIDSDEMSSKCEMEYSASSCTRKLLGSQQNFYFLLAILEVRRRVAYHPSESQTNPSNRARPGSPTWSATIAALEGSTSRST